MGAGPGGRRVRGRGFGGKEQLGLKLGQVEVGKGPCTEVGWNLGSRWGVVGVGD